MSLERAYNNCRICYHITKNMRKDWVDYKLAQAMAPMNEAMRALEEEREYSTRHATGERTKRYKIAEDALQACMDCEFKSAGIVEFLARALPDQFKKPEKQEASK